MRAHEIHLGLGDGAHADLVEGTREESGEGAAEHDVPVPAAEPDAHAADVLFSDEALHIAVGEGVLVGEGEGGVLGVSVESHNTLVVLAKLDQSVSVDLTSGHLQEKGVEVTVEPLRKDSPNKEHLLRILGLKAHFMDIFSIESKMAALKAS